MTFREAVEILKDAGVDNPAFDARALWLAFVGGAGYPLPSDTTENSDFLNALSQRASRKPLQYLIGSVGFYREEYEVSPDCLIPRSDTELLVDVAVKRLNDGAKFIDLCTGSGCVAISTLANTKNTTALAVDVSPRALELARRNAERNGVRDRVKLVECDLLHFGEELAEGFDAVLSNPPYVTASAYEGLEKEIFYEPRLAFVGGEDGLDFYKRLIPLAKRMISPTGFIAFEIGFDQGESVSAIAADCGLNCEILRDLSDLARVALLTFSPSEL